MKLIGWVIGILLAVAGVIGILHWYLAPDDLVACKEIPDETKLQCRKADAIVAISGGDTKARTAEAIRLFQKGWADTLIFSGAAYDPTSPSNAQAMKAQAIAAGISEQQIAIEEYARDTAENAKQTLAIASERGVNRIILVTSGYHQRRAGIEFRQTFENVVIIDHPVPRDEHWSENWWLTRQGWWLVAGELVKIMYTLMKAV